MYRALLVPLDGSPLSERALPIAQDLARRSGAALHLAHVHLPSSTPLYTADLPLSDTWLDERASESERDYLETLAGQLRSDSDVSISTALLAGEITDSIADIVAEYVLEQHIDMVVMTTHGRNGLARFWLGSVADELVRGLPVPVLLLRPGAAELSSTATPAPQRILIPLDGSATAETILPHALALSQAAQVEYTLLRVVETMMVARPMPPNPALRELDDQLIDNLRVDAQIYLEQLAERLIRQGLTVHIEVVVAPQAALTILEQAKQHRSNLIAMATHGRHGLARLLLGSVADHLLRRGSPPLLLYRAPAQPGGPHG
jgi:nucleotide-binding universal stress UspA family protein